MRVPVLVTCLAFLRTGLADIVVRPDCDIFNGANCAGHGQICCGYPNGNQYLFCSPFDLKMHKTSCPGRLICIQYRNNCIIGDYCGNPGEVCCVSFDSNINS